MVNAADVSKLRSIFGAVLANDIQCFAWLIYAEMILNCQLLCFLWSDSLIFFCLNSQFSMLFLMCFIYNQSKNCEDCVGYGECHCGVRIGGFQNLKSQSSFWDLKIYKDNILAYQYLVSFQWPEVCLQCSFVCYWKSYFFHDIPTCNTWCTSSKVINFAFHWQLERFARSGWNQLYLTLGMIHWGQ